MSLRRYMPWQLGGAILLAVAIPSWVYGQAKAEPKSDAKPQLKIELKPIEIKGPGILLTKETGIRSVAFLDWTPEESTEKLTLTGIEIK